MYYRLRQREQTPVRVAFSVGAGTFIGCQPLYGLHLVLCLGAAKLFRLSAAISYLAAHVNNPWTAPFLIYLEATVGHRLMRGSWLGLDPGELRDLGALGLGRDLFVGSGVVGLALGGLLTAFSLWVGRRWKRSPFRSRLVNRTARRYMDQGLRIWEAVRAKVRYDPVYLGLLRSIRWPSTGRLLDLGCGRGLLLAAVRASEELAAEGHWPDGWPPAPQRLQLTGIEVDPKAAAVARAALAEGATIVECDLATATVPSCDVVALLDVLHYLDADAQERLIAQIAERLAPGGLLLLREADAGGGLRFWLTRVQERLSSWARREWARPFHYRSEDNWRELLSRQGLEVESRPMASGTPFANVLVEARRPRLTDQD